MANSQYSGLLHVVAQRDATALAGLLAQAEPGDTSDSILLFHAIAAANWSEAVPVGVASGVPISAGDWALRHAHGRLAAALPPLSDWQVERLQVSVGTCSLSLAATLGHSATLAALLAAGADPNPADPLGRRMWHPLAAAAMSTQGSWNSGRLQQTVPESVAAEMCQLLLIAGADVLMACGSAYQPRQGRWLLSIQSPVIQHLLLAATTQNCQQVPSALRPSFEQCSELLLAAVQADDAAAYSCFAAAVPAGQPAAEHANLAEEAVATACSGRGQCTVLQHMVELVAAGGEAAGSADTAAGVLGGRQLAAGVGEAPKAALRGAAQEGQLGEVLLLLSARVPVTAAAIRGAVVGGQLEALTMLLPRVAHEELLPVEPPSSMAFTLPSSSHLSCQYPCPLLTLIAIHASEEHEVLHRPSLEMAEALVAAGFRPAVYHNVLMQQAGEEMAHRVSMFDPAMHDATLQAHVQARGRFLWLAVTHPNWSRAANNRFPAAFRRATRTLMLTAHHMHTHINVPGAAGSSVGHRAAVDMHAAPGLGHVPEHVLCEIIGLAAYPLSSWAKVL